MRGLRVCSSLVIKGALLIALLALPLQSAQAAAYAWKYYASPAGSALHACTLDDPCDIETAIEIAVDGDSIYLYEGTYTDYAGFVIADVSESINFYGGLYGHLHTTNGLQLLIDPVNHPSTLDGQNYRSGMYIHRVDVGVPVTTVIDGIRFINGHGNKLIANECSGIDPSAEACGGAIFIFRASTTIQNCVFYSNKAEWDTTPDGMKGFGGAVFADLSFNDLVIRNNYFEFNRASIAEEGDGGAIAIHGDLGAVNIQNNILKNNIATKRGGAIAVWDYGYGSLLVAGNRFEGNMANEGGAGIILYMVDDATITNNWFEGQIDQINGTIQVSDSSMVFSGNTLIDNDSKFGLDVFGDYGNNVQLINNLFVRSGSEATIWIYGYSYNTGDEFIINLKHNTLVGNMGINSRAIMLFSNYCNGSHCGEVLMDNNIIYRYALGLSASYPAQITADYTLFSFVSTKSTGQVINNHEVIVESPGFRNVLFDNYRLKANAGACDQGKDAGVYIDFEGDLRPLDGGFDVGYDEFAYHTYIPLVEK